MKILDIQKNLLISHLGLVGINEELLETFPVQKLIDKSDDQVCVAFKIHFQELKTEVLLKVIEATSKVLEIEARSVERKGADSNTFMVQVFYDSLKMHWSDKAPLKYEELSKALSSFDVKVSVDVSMNN